MADPLLTYHHSTTGQPFVYHIVWFVHDRCVARVLARISKMPVQNSNFKISARPDLATRLLQILIPKILYGLLCQKRKFTPQLCHRKWFGRKIFTSHKSKLKILCRNFACLKRRISGNCLSKRWAGCMSPG